MDRICYWAMFVAAFGCAFRHDVHGVLFFMLAATLVRLGVPGEKP